MDLTVYFLTFALVFIDNILPILGPPTWIVLSLIAFFYPIPSLPLFIFVALCAATLGRFVLATFSEKIIRNRFLGVKYRLNMEKLKKHLSQKPLITSTVFLLEAFTPLSSDQLFIAYGLTGLKLRYALIPFFIGRMFTYSFLVYATTGLAKNADALLSASYLGASFLILTAALFILLYFFVKIDWEKVILNRKLRLLR